MVVMKFGGTSVGNAERIRHVAGLVCKSEPGSVAVIVSAMAGVTNMLIETARLATEGNDEYHTHLSRLREHHRATAAALLPGDEAREAERFIDAQLAGIDSLCQSVAVIGELPMRVLDRIAAVGEKLSANLLAATLRCMGRDAKYVDATQMLVTDSKFGGATPLMEETRARAEELLRPLMAQGTVPVITGYIGADKEGNTTTLGRGGGDYSAAIFGAVLDADEVWVWTDVDGILTADPKIVPDARTLEELTYVEAAQIAYFGAEVLHPKTVQPLVERGIPLRIRNTLNPSHPGTLIVERSSRPGSGPRAIITTKDLSAIAVVGNNENWSPEISARALSVLASSGVEVLMFGQSFVDKTVSLLVRGQDAEHALRVLKREFESHIQRGAVQDINVQAPVASVSVVGAHADDSFSLASRTFGALGRQRARILTIAQAFSEYSVTFVLPQADVDATVRSIHAELGLGS